MNCLCASTRRASRLLSRHYESCLRPANLTPAQFELMEALHRRPDQSQAALAAALELDQTTLSRNLKLLINRQWVQSASSSVDRRKACYSLTSTGEATWEAAFPHWQTAQAVLEQCLGPDWQAALQLMARIGAAVPG